MDQQSFCEYVACWICIVTSASLAAAGIFFKQFELATFFAVIYLLSCGWLSHFSGPSE